jgi:uncharacterized glyoxalase superfamily protein PhnB
VFDENLRYLSAFPAIEVPDLEQAAAWYRAALGFGRLNRGSDERSDWLHLRRSEGQDLVLRAVDSALETQVASAPPSNVSIHLAVDEPLDDVAATARDAGAKLVHGKTLRDPYGLEWVLFSRTRRR